VFAIAKILSPTDVGRINIMLAALTILTAIGNFGTTTSVLKLCSENIREEEIQNLFVHGFLLNIVSSVTTYLITIIIVFSKILTNDNVLIHSLPYFLLNIFCATLSNYFFAYLQSRQEIKFISKLQASLNIYSICFVIISTFAWKYEGFVWSYIFTSIASLIIYVFFILRYHKKIYFNFEKLVFKKIFHLSKYGAFANQLGQLLQYLDTLVMSGLRVDLAGIGYYSLAQYFILGANQITYSINQVVMPMLSFKSNEIENWKISYNNYQKIYSRTTLVVSGLTAVCGPLVIYFFLKPNYRISIIYLLILIIGFIARTRAVPKSIATWSLGRLDYNFYSSLYAAIINFILNVSLILLFGAMGAASATSIAYIMAIPIFSHYFNKELKARESVNLTHLVVDPVL
jgi:O-antigen/teichoic acid export membrane protein